jgi:hypothetical protein
MQKAPTSPDLETFLFFSVPAEGENSNNQNNPTGDVSNISLNE